MAKLIILRFHPDKPMLGVVFANYLNDVVTQVFDASLTNPTGQQPANVLGSTAITPSKIDLHIYQHPQPCLSSRQIGCQCDDPVV
jgi:hypothetical protein